MDVRRGAAIAAGIAMSCQLGCSFMFVKGPPDNHAELASVECSNGYGWPAFDAIWAGLNGLGAATATDKQDASGMSTGPSKDQIVAVGATWLLVSGISAIYGFTQVAQCREAKQRHELAAGGISPDVALRQCRKERVRALEEVQRERDPRERARLFRDVPVCHSPSSTVPARAAAPAPVPAPAAEPAPAATPAPAAEPAPAPSPTSSRLLRPVHPRSLAMRPASATEWPSAGP